MRDLRYGIEIEMTGLSRGKAAETLAGFFGTRGNTPAAAMTHTQCGTHRDVCGRLYRTEHPDAEKGAWTNCCSRQYIQRGVGKPGLCL